MDYDESVIFAATVLAETGRTTVALDSGILEDYQQFILDVAIEAKVRNIMVRAVVPDPEENRVLLEIRRVPWWEQVKLRLGSLN